MNDDNGLTERRRRDVEDLNNEVAGRDVGRITRFLGPDATVEAVERKKREARAFQNRLLELLNDPIYRAKHEAVQTALRDAERATESALSQLETEIAATKDAISDMEDRAARLPDGTMVFRDANGVVRRSDGSVVEDDLAATILWTGSEPSLEEYLSLQDKLAILEAQQDQVHAYQNDVLGSARDHLTDPDNPPSLEGLDDILDGISTGMPDAVRAQLPDNTPDTALNVDVTSVSIPDLGAKR